MLRTYGWQHVGSCPLDYDYETLYVTSQGQRCESRIGIESETEALLISIWAWNKNKRS